MNNSGYDVQGDDEKLLPVDFYTNKKFSLNSDNSDGPELKTYSRLTSPLLTDSKSYNYSSGSSSSSFSSSSSSSSASSHLSMELKYSVPELKYEDLSSPEKALEDLEDKIKELNDPQLKALAAEERNAKREADENKRTKEAGGCTRLWYLTRQCFSDKACAPLYQIWERKWLLICALSMAATAGYFWHEANLAKGYQADVFRPSSDPDTSIDLLGYRSDDILNLVNHYWNLENLKRMGIMGAGILTTSHFLNYLTTSRIETENVLTRNAGENNTQVIQKLTEVTKALVRARKEDQNEIKKLQIKINVTEKQVDTLMQTVNRLSGNVDPVPEEEIKQQVPETVSDDAEEQNGKKVIATVTPGARGFNAGISHEVTIYHENQKRNQQNGSNQTNPTQSTQINF